CRAGRSLRAGSTSGGGGLDERRGYSSRRRRWTNSKPKRPFTHKWPWVTSLSSGEVTLTIVLSWTCSSRLQPTPQYGQTVDVTVCWDSSQVPAWRMLYSDTGMSAPVGHTPMQLPQYTQAESGRVTSNSVEILASKPRPATAIANVFCASSPQASTHL